MKTKYPYRSQAYATKWACFKRVWNLDSADRNVAGFYLLSILAIGIVVLVNFA